MKNYGDSITAGTAATAGNGYATLLTSALNLSNVNAGHSGDQAADCAIAAYAAITGEPITLMIGTNDQWKYGTNTTKQSYYKQFLTGILVHQLCPYYFGGRDSQILYTGSWNNTQASFSKGKNCNQDGGTAIATVQGTAVYIGIIMQDVVVNDGRNADVYIDDALVGTINCSAPGMNTQNGAAYAPAAYRFGGLSSGQHTVKIIVHAPQGGLQICYLEYITGNNQKVKPPVYMSTIPKYNATGYATWGGSDSNVDAYNSIIRGLSADFITDGLNLHLVDSAFYLNPMTDLSSDGLHPNNNGHLAIKNAFYDIINI